MKTFEELECWKKAAELRRSLSELVKGFPDHEQFKLTDQIIKASRSVTSNIAEGYGRYNYQEYAQFCRQSRSSLYELMDHLIIATDEKYITKTQFVEFKSEIEECITLINSFINSLMKSKSRTGSKFEEPELSYEFDSLVTIND
jgi:four helix bundle protein